LRGLRYSLDELVKYLRKYPDFMSDIMTLHESFDIQKVKQYFSNLDLSAPFHTNQLHKGYIRYQNEIKEIVMNPKSYSLKIDHLDQSYLDEEHVMECFNKTVNIYDSIMSRYWPSGREEFIRWLDPQPKEKILEIGAGTGLNFEYYPNSCEVTAIDRSEAMLTIAKKRLVELRKENVKLLVMDAQKMNFPDNSFDKVFSTYVFCDVQNPLKALREVKRVCKPNGRVVMVDPLKSEIEEVAVLQYLFWPIGRQMGHLWLSDFPPYSILYNTWLDLFPMLKEVGLDVEKAKSYDPFKILHLITCRNTK
jgi:ubiquinone/menaquinone biosynthesis C-methylase UbiE